MESEPFFSAGSLSIGSEELSWGSVEDGTGGDDSEGVVAGCICDPCSFPVSSGGKKEVISGRLVWEGDFR